MSCQICFIQYDHSLHKPISLSCPHSICQSCLNQLNDMKCPCCQAPIIHSYQNMCVLEMIPKSEYDQQKSKLIESINLAKDLNSNRIIRIDEKHLFLKDQIEVLKNTINNETDRFIDLIRKNQKNLLNEANDLEETVVSNIEQMLNEIKTKQYNENINELYNKKSSIEANELNELQMTKFNEWLDKVTSSSNDALKQLENLKINFNFVIRDNINSTTGVIGEITCEDKQTAYETYVNKIWNSDEETDICIYFNKAIELNQNDTEAYYAKGSQLKDLKQFERAIECFNKCIEIDPNIRNFFLKKGSCLLELKRYDESLEFLNKAIELSAYYDCAHNDAFDCNVFSEKGKLLIEFKKNKEAINCFDKALEILERVDSECCFYRFEIPSKVYYLKGKALMELKQYNESLICFNKAINIKPKEATFHNSKGLCYLEMNEFEFSIGSFTKASQIEPENEIYLNNINLAKNKQIGNKFSLKSFLQELIPFY